MVTATLNLTFDENVLSEDDLERIESINFAELQGIEQLVELFKRFPLPRRGDIRIELLSPSGTMSILLPHRERDAVPIASFYDGEGYIDWPFMSVHFWGEDPRGEWTLTFRYRGMNHSASFEGLSINLHGTLKTPEAVVDYSDCNSTCLGGCARGGSSEYCHRCANLRHAETLECIDVCPAGFQEVNGYCYDPNLPAPQCNKTVEGMCQCHCCNQFV